MKVIKYCTIIITFLLSILLAITLYDVSTYPNEYVNIYKIDINSENWSTKNISNYFLKESFILGITFIGFLISLASILMRSKVLDKLCLSIFIAIICYILYSLNMYFTDGYSH